MHFQCIALPTELSRPELNGAILVERFGLVKDGVTIRRVRLPNLSQSFGGGWCLVTSAVFKIVVGPVWSEVGSTPIHPRFHPDPSGLKKLRNACIQAKT